MSASVASYMPRIGIAVVTGGRTCLAIHNANLAPGTPVMLVNPMLPQTTTAVEIGAPAQGACPVTKELDTTVSNYDLRVASGANLPKFLPLIAVMGTTAGFTPTTNNTLQADLDQNGKFETFRACSGTDGVHLTVWSGNPLDGTLLWHGYYYEPGNPGLGPACTAKETAGL
ncbi:MAG: hypothetical protein JO091_07210 [Acidobacteriaceae bacterium]|nr:hypothetical protein [Acidobacteriaceae bacterium]